MQQYKRAKVIMLPTENKEKSSMLLGVVPNLIVETKAVLKDTSDWMKFGKPQHLHIISDDEIKEGDWCLDTVNNILFISDGNSKLHKSTDKKIIATTDTSLKYFINSNGNKSSHELTKSGYIEFLPQPSQHFIEKYIESYNKGTQIIDILVQYEEY